MKIVSEVCRHVSVHAVEDAMVSDLTDDSAQLRTRKRTCAVTPLTLEQ